jgi:hypothetical protein
MATKKKELVGGATTSLKNMMEFVNGKDDMPYMEIHPFMFETTSQFSSSYSE